MSPTTTVIPQLLDALARVPFVVGVLTKGSLLVLVAVGLTRLLARAPAAARHLVWSLSVVGLLLLPASTLSPWRLELTPLAAARDALGLTPPGISSGTSQHATADARHEHSGTSLAPPASATEPAAPIIEPEQSAGAESPASSPQLRVVSTADLTIRLRDPATLLVLAWIGGMMWMFGRLGVGVVHVRRMVRQAVPADGAAWHTLADQARRSLGAPSGARIVISRRAAMPFTYGLFRPVIVLPASAEEWTDDRRRSVLLHELAHLRRHDLVTNAIVQLACAVYWFHPLVSLAGRRVRIEAERACDALVVAAGTRPSDYAGDLLEIARTMRSGSTAAVALAMARRSDFEGRLLAILAPDSGRNVLTAARAALIALSFAAPAAAIAAVVPASRVAPNATAAAPDSDATTAASADAGVSQAVPAVRMADSASRPGQGTTSDSQAPANPQGRDTAVPALLSVLKDENVAVRLAAVQALGNLEDPRAVDALVQALRTDSDAGVREAAASALGEIESARAVPGLIAALGSERVAAVRAKIAWALGEIEDARAVEALGAAVRDPEVEVRRQVVWALGEIESATAVPMLIPALRDADAETRKQAAWALGEIESPDAIDALATATKDANAEVRKEAVSALGQIEDKRALPALTVAIGDAEVEVRRQAIEAIGQLDDLGSAPPALISALKDPDREVRKAAAEAVGQLEDEAAVPALIPLTRDADGDVKRAAVEALANIGGTRAIETLAALLKDDDPEIRKLAAEALGKNR
jgi:HEAT repeat protein/beta-lactamase regulating signal transducer with metallopeptidase domain